MANLLNYQNACYAQCIIFTVSGAALVFAPDSIVPQFINAAGLSGALALPNSLLTDAFRSIGVLHAGSAGLFCNVAHADGATKNKICYATTVFNAFLFGLGIYLIRNGRWRNNVTNSLLLLAPSGIMAGVFGLLSLDALNERSY